VELAVTWPILVVAFFCLTGGIGLYVWAVRRPRARHLNSTNLIAWLLIALFPTLVIFSFFPDSSAEGEFVGFGLTGAIAAFAGILVFGSRAGAEAIARDQRVEDVEAENERLKAGEQPAQGQAPGKRLIRQQRDLRYRVQGRRGTELVIRTGELADVKDVDVWVSSENTNMQMARYYDKSISSLVRYLGARKDEARHPVEDLVNNELRECMARMGTLVVEPATVIATGPGDLRRTHRVKRIYHVAAVRGQVGAGYGPVDNIGECVTAALERLDEDTDIEDRRSTILFPLLGTGTASGDPAIVHELIVAAAQYLRQHAQSRAKTVYFLARHHEDLVLCADAAASCDTLTAMGGSAEPLLPHRPAA
jgi:hypothetical protein